MLFEIVKKQLVPLFLATISNCTKCLFHTLQKTGKKNIASEAGVYCLFDNRCYNNKPDSDSNWIPCSVTLPTKESVGIFCTSGEITLSLCLTS